MAAAMSISTHGIISLDETNLLLYVQQRAERHRPHSIPLYLALDFHK